MIQSRKQKAPKTGKKNKNRSNKDVVIQVRGPTPQKRGKLGPSVNPSSVRDGWLASLINPWRVGGFRIPDTLVAPTATATLRDRFTVLPSQDGSTGNYACGVSFTPTVNGSYGQIQTYSSSAGTVSFPSQNGYTTFSQNAAFLNVARDFRVVSAGLAVYSTVASQKSQGRNICVFFPGADDLIRAAQGPASFSFANFLAQANNSDTPTNEMEVCTITWVPSDETNYEFHGTAASSDGVSGVAAFGGYNPGTIIWIANGIDPSASYEVDLVLNIEYHPSTAAISFVNSQPSKCDFAAFQKAINHPVVSNMFHNVGKDSVMIVSPSNNTASLTSSFLNGASDYLGGALNDASYRIGQTLAGFGARTASRSVQSWLMSNMIGRPSLM